MPAVAVTVTGPLEAGGVGDGVGVGVGVGVTVGIGVGVGKGVGVADGIGEGVGTGLSVQGANRNEPTRVFQPALLVVV